MLLPIAVIIVFSFNDPAGKFNFTWAGLHARALERTPSAIPELNDALLTSLELAALSTIDRDDPRHDDRARPGPPPVLRPPGGEPPDRDPDGDARGRDRRRAALDVPDLRPITLGFATLLIAHVMFSISFVVVVVRSRLIGFDRRLEEAARDLGADAARRPSARSPCR